MILQYFRKKENQYKNTADEIYLYIVDESRILIKKKYFKEINFNTSFELVSILTIFYLKILKDKKEIRFKKINDEIVNNLISDFDKTFREMGIGDISIGKYVKKYVKKFYYRIKKLDNILNNINADNLLIFLNSIKTLDKKYLSSLASDLMIIYQNINKKSQNL